MSRGLIVCGAGMAVAGLLVMATAGAPTSALAVQAGAVVIGLLLVWMLARGSGVAPRTSLIMMAAGVAMIGLTLVVGPDVSGVRRWVAAGPVLIQPAMILLPPMIWLYGRGEATWVWAGMMGVAALLVALQPDVAGAAALAGGAGAVAVLRRSRADVVLSVVAVGALVWAATRIDPLPPVAYVEQAAETALQAQPLIGAMGWLVLLTLPLPFLLWRRSRANGAMAACWAGLAGAGVFGNFPEPLVGYSASLALGWMASLGLAARPSQKEVHA